MAERPKSDPVPDPFDMKTVEFLAALMSQNDLSVVDLRDGQRRIRMQRGAAVTAVPAAHTAPAALAPAHPTPAPPAAVPAAPVKNLLLIRSPMLGTFYNREKPDAKPYVAAGSKVTPTTVVGLIEAMKLYNEVPAECSGTVVEVCVENGAPVEYNQVLFKVDPAG